MFIQMNVGVKELRKREGPDSLDVDNGMCKKVWTMCTHRKMGSQTARKERVSERKER